MEVTPSSLVMRWLTSLENGYAVSSNDLVSWPWQMMLRPVDSVADLSGSFIFLLLCRLRMSHVGQQNLDLLRCQVGGSSWRGSDEAGEGGGERLKGLVQSGRYWYVRSARSMQWHFPLVPT